ncbi:MAG TPA: riboflavin kinase [Patescibacteria group bacterium]
MSKILKITGKVYRGQGKGRKLGFKTANLSPDSNQPFPPAGVYASLITIDDQPHKSVTAVGIFETFEQTKPGIEVYIFNFDQDIYNQPVDLELIKKIRPIKKFLDASELKQQISRDCVEAMKILARF